MNVWERRAEARRLKQMAVMSMLMSVVLLVLAGATLVSGGVYVLWSLAAYLWGLLNLHDLVRAVRGATRLEA